MSAQLHILIVEDSDMDAELLLLRLRKESFDVNWKIVQTQIDYLTALETRYDLIFSDWSLPQFSGLEALKLLRERDLETPFIIVSGRIGEEAAVDALRLGAYDYIPKDHLNRLGQVIHNALEHKRLRAEHRQTENLLRLQAAALNAAANAIIITDRNGVIEWANPAFTTLTGYTTAEALGKNPRDLIKSGHHDAEFYTQLWNTILSGEVWRGEMVNRRKDGRFYTEELTITPIYGLDGQISQFVAVKEDISVQKQADMERRQLEDKFMKAFHISPDAININRLKDGLYIDINEGFISLTSYTEKDVIGKTSLEIDIWVDPQDRKRLVRGLRENGEVTNLEALFRAKTGQIKTCLMSAKIIEVNGEECILSITRDITERKKIEMDFLHQVEENIQRKEELETLSEVSSAMRQATTISEMVPLLVRQSMAVIKAQTGVLALLEENKLKFRGGMGLLEVFNEMTLTRCEDLLWESINLEDPRFVEAWQIRDASQFFGLMMKGLSACVVAPLKTGSTIIGLLMVGFLDSHPFSDTDRRLITAISEMAGSTLQRMSITETLEKMVEARSRELESIYQITSAASESMDIEQSFKQALSLVMKALDTQIGAIFLLDEESAQVEMVVDHGIPDGMRQKVKLLRSDDDFAGWVVRNNKALLLSNMALNTHAEEFAHDHQQFAFAGLPMRVHDRVVGVLCVLRPAGQQLNLEEITLLSFIADHLALILENTRLFHKEEQNAILKERSRLARELHDSVTQLLYSAVLFSAGAQEYAAQGNLKQVAGYIQQFSELIHQALKEMRLMVYELRSPGLGASGLTAALKYRLDAVEKRAGINVDLESDELSLLSARTEEGLYRISLEALNNALKHANAERVSIALRMIDGHVSLTIEDNGQGFDLVDALENGGMGLLNMKERAEKMDGVLEIDSKPGAGTRIVAIIPV